MKLSPQQSDFIEFMRTGTGSCVLEAVAGAGKTTTLLEAVSAVRGQVAICAYNKAIAEEIKGKLLARGVDWKKAQAGTVHSFGFGAWRKLRPSVRVDGDKLTNLYSSMFAADEDVAPAVRQLVSLAKQFAVDVPGSGNSSSADSFWLEVIERQDVEVPDERLSFVIDACRSVLRESNALCDRLVDFDDMVYAPLLFKVPFWRFDVVMVDEAQDTNMSRRLMVAAMLKPRGRLIAVGDPRQAIYGFTGADGDSLDRIRSAFRAVTMPLTVTYRCPKAVVEFVHQWVDHIQAHPDAPEGEVTSETLSKFMERQHLSPDDVMLCRNTKPLVAVAYELIRNGKACRIEGRDIGVGLINLIRKFKVKDLESLSIKVTEWRVRQSLLMTSKGRSPQSVEDKADTVLLLIEKVSEDGGETPQDVIGYIGRLFGDTPAGQLPNVFTLATVHRSKGREWDRVFLLDRAGLMPSKWARQDWQKVQEDNLIYVAATRAKRVLVEVT